MSNVESNALQKTDLDLNTSGNLPEAPITTGMSPDSLAGTTRAALTSGFESVSNPTDWVLEKDGMYLTHDQKTAMDRAKARC